MINFYGNGSVILGDGGYYHVKGNNPTISSDMIGHPDLIERDTEERE